MFKYTHQQNLLRNVLVSQLVPVEEPEIAADSLFVCPIYRYPNAVKFNFLKPYFYNQVSDVVCGTEIYIELYC